MKSIIFILLLFTSFFTARSQVYINSYAITTAVLDSLPLDVASGKSGYSLRKIRTDYAGSAVRVRRSSDNAQQDIGFDGSGNFDAAAFTTFVGAGTGFVVTWYDQGVNGYNATQATTTLQPVITLSAQNGHPVATFAADYLTIPASESFFIYLHSTGGMMLSALKIGTSADPNAFYAIAGNVAGTSSKTGFELAYDDRASQSRNNALYSIAGKSVASQAPIDRFELNIFTPNVFTLLNAQIDPDNATAGDRIEYYINNIFTNATNANPNAPVTTNATHPFQIGAGGNNTGPFTGAMAEIIIYDALHTDNTRDAIAANVNAYYNIY